MLRAADASFGGSGLTCLQRHSDVDADTYRALPSKGDRESRADGNHGSRFGRTSRAAVTMIDLLWSVVEAGF